MRWLSKVTRAFGLATFDDALDWPDDPFCDDDEDLGVQPWGLEPAPEAPAAGRWAA